VTLSDDSTVGNDDVAYRRVHPNLAPPDANGVPRLSSAVFKVNTADQGLLSVYLKSELAKIPALPVDCVAPGAPHSIAELDVADIRLLGHGVIRDPVTDADVPNTCDPAHALITGFRADRKILGQQARALLAKARWSKPGSTVDLGVRGAS
jgi:hypothetical protein